MGEQRYTANGHEVVLRHKDDATDTTYGNHSAWFGDGSISINLNAAYNNRGEYPEFVREEMSDELVNASEEELERLLAYLADNDLLVCGCGRTFHEDNSVSTGFAGVKCEKCANDDKYCPETDDNTHEMRVIRGRNNARRDTVRKCKHCGKKSRTPATG